MLHTSSLVTASAEETTLVRTQRESFKIKDNMAATHNYTVIYLHDVYCMCEPRNHIIFITNELKTAEQGVHMSLNHWTVIVTAGSRDSGMIFPLQVLRS